MGRARDEAGNIWETDAQGNPVRMIQAGNAPAPASSGVFTLPPDPMQQNADRRAEEQLRIAREREARMAAEGGKSRFRVLSTQEKMARGLDPSGDYQVSSEGQVTAITQPRNQSAQLTAHERSQAIAGYTSAQAIKRLVADLKKKYEAGPGKTSGVQGVTDYLPFTVNKQFDKASEAARGDVKRALGFTGGENNTAAESAQNIGPYLPEAGDRDAVILDKIQRLENLAKDSEDRSIAVLGGVPDANGRVTPVGTKHEQKQPAANTSGAVPTGAVKAATGDSHDIADPETSQAIDAMVRAGVPLEAANAYVTSKGYQPIEAPMWNKAVTFAKQFPNSPGSFGGFVRPEKNTVMNDIAGSTGGAAAMHGVNALTGGVPSLLAGEQGQQALSASSEAHPFASIAGDVAGNIGGALTVGKLLKPLNFLGKTPEINAARRYLAGDAIYGATFGATQNPDNPVQGGMFGAGASVAGNAAGRYLLAPGLRAAAGSRPGQKVFDFLGMNRAPAPLAPGQNMVLNQADRAGLPAITGRLDEAASLNLPYALADTDPALRTLAGSAARKSPDALRLADETFRPRHLGQAERAISGIDTHLARTGDLPAIKDDALTRANAASKPLYERAMSQPAPDDAKLGEFLRTPAGEDAAREAYTIALNKGENPAELSFSVDASGAPRIDATPNWKTLQYIKMGVDTTVEKFRDPVSGKLNLKNPSIKGLEDFRKGFVKHLGDLNPDYKAANATYGKIADQGTAAERGYKATSSRVTPEQTAAAIGNTQPDSLPYFRQGFASSMADAAERARLSADPYSTIYGSTSQQAKVGTVFPEGAPRFDRLRNLEGDMSRTFQETLGGSPTAPRTEADKMFEGGGFADTAFDIGVSAATGVPPINLLRQGVGSGIKDVLKFGVGKGAKAKADAIAPILYNTDPAATKAMLDELVQLRDVRRAYVDRSRRIGGMFGAPVPLLLTNQQ
jgi:hypothetical protein